jgi:muconate cycloisomerase
MQIESWVEEIPFKEPLSIAVRQARPDVRLAIDANEGWTMDHLDRMIGTLLAQGVELIEQPLPASGDTELADYRSPIAVSAWPSRGRHAG